MSHEIQRVNSTKWLDIEDVWGIGKQHALRLRELGVRKAYDFTQLPDEWVKQHMSIVGLRLKKELSGIRTLDLEEDKKKKNIATTRSFNINYSTYDQIKERVVTFAAICAEKLRKQDSCCNVIQVFVLTNRFRSDQPQYSKSVTIHLPFPTNSGVELAKFAEAGLKQIYKEGYQYKKAGVIVMEISPADCGQQMIFKNSDPKHAHLFAVVDKLNKAYGQQKVKLAAQDLGRTWKMKQERLSPRYTTQLKDIIVVNAK
jgi:DNA polymerase V